MNTWSEYFLTMGVLLLLYYFFRVLLSWDGPTYENLPSFTPSDWNRTVDPGKPIDASPLCARIESVRQAYQAKLQPKPMSFKRALRVRDKRDEIAQSAFFRKSAPADAHDETRDAGHISTLTLV